MSSHRPPVTEPQFDLGRIRKQQARPRGARLRIIIAGDPSRPMRTISLPHALPAVAFAVAAGLLVATVLLARGSWRMSDAVSGLERRVRSMVQAAGSVALDPGGVSTGILAGGGWAESMLARRPGGPMVHAPAGQVGRFTILSSNNGEEMEVAINLSTGEMEPGAYRRLRHLMRCLHTGAETPIDPRLLDLLYRISQRTHQKILLVSGFRAPMYSAAQLSYHTRGMAADIRIPGMTALMARDLAESMGVHGLGYYPVSGFIHVDVRDVRTRWIDYGVNRQDGEGAEHGPEHGTFMRDDPDSDEGGEPEASRAGGVMGSATTVEAAASGRGPWPGPAGPTPAAP